MYGLGGGNFAFLSAGEIILGYRWKKNIISKGNLIVKIFNLLPHMSQSNGVGYKGGTHFAPTLHCNPSSFVFETGDLMAKEGPHYTR